MAQPKSYLSPADRARINRELADIRARRSATADVREGDGQYFRPPEVNIDDGHLRAREDQLKEVLERETPPTLDPSRKNAAFREFKALLPEFETNALSKYDQGLGYPEIMKKTGLDHQQDYERAKAKAMAWEFSPRGQYVANRLKELAGVLDRDNPDLRNLEHFRRRK